MPAQVKTAVLHIRVTAAEKRAIQQAAKRDALTVSAWLRFVALCAAAKR